MKLYTWTTPNGQKPMIMLEELGLDYHREWVDLSKGEQHTPQFLGLNPNGKIPALVDGSVTVFESAAILFYLGEKLGRFLPEKGSARYETVQWTYFQMADIGPMFGQAFHFQSKSRSGELDVTYSHERYKNEADRLYRVCDTHLADREYFAAGQYTIADMALYPWVRGAEMLGFDWSDYPNVERWCDKIGDRAAVQRAIHFSPESDG